VKNQIDAIDIRILSELTNDAEIPFVKLAKKLKVSNTLIHQRVKKLKAKGIIKKATFEIDPYSLGFQTSAYIQIRIENNKYHKDIEEKLKKIPEIVECVNISGPYAILVKILARNNRHLRDIIYEEILEIDGVENTNSTFSFETAFRISVPVHLEPD
jgi:Lrp/AsnC family transcriptional regulator for asnA, asnC and gidA